MIVATTGFYDGVHLGHRAVLEEVVSLARAKGEESSVITFWPHPRSVLQQDADGLKLLTTLEEKKALIRSAGIDSVRVVSFTKDFSRLTAEDFIRDYLKGKFGVSALVIGYDHRFGHDDGTGRSIEQICTEYGIECRRIGKVTSGDLTYSSTKIRNFLLSGQIEKANGALGYSYGMEGVVVSGKHFGRVIGFPTANMQPSDPRKLIPGDGVYFVRVSVGGNFYKGICNVGNRPTVDDSNVRTIETHILDFDEDIYGLDMRVDFLRRIRDIQRFSSGEELRRQLLEDRAVAEASDLPSEFFSK